jgi:hypothetical protein
MQPFMQYGWSKEGKITVHSVAGNRPLWTWHLLTNPYSNSGSFHIIYRLPSSMFAIHSETVFIFLNI